jgi:hypothetical protein
MGRRHAIALLTLAAITGLWLLPVLSRFSTAIPGTGAGDNVTFVWNIWWMRYVLNHPGHSFFSTPFLFYPFGADLTLHTHTALPAFIAAVAGPASLVASQNLLIVLHIYLNFVCSYALGYRTTRRVSSALVAAVVFGTSTFVGAHLMGHFNLSAAWIVPLVCLLAWDASESTSLTRGVLAGAAVAAAAYIDYYLFIYAVGLVGLFLMSRSVLFSLPRPAPSRLRRHALTVVSVLLSIDALVIAAILLRRGDRIDLGPLRISVRSINNPITAAWILALVGGAFVAWSRVEIGFRSSASRRSIRVPIAAAIVAMVLLTPLLIHATRLWTEGRYVSQEYRWRSAPGGIDAATLILGNPFHVLWGERVRGVYAALHIDPIEASAWIPISALILAAIAVAARRRDPLVQQWAIVGAVFMTWALGPWLIAFGRQTPLMLPAIVVRYVPIVANARIPGRAMVVVYLVVAMLAAMGVAWLSSRQRTGRMAGWCLVLMLALECAPAPPPMYVPDMPSQYAALRNLARAGAVCELPLGIRDGFGETGTFDSAVLLHQTLHERPIVGGFLARLEPRVAHEYAAMPVVGSFLRLSSGGKLSDEPVVMTPREAASSLASAGIAFVVLDTRTASPDLIQYVQSGIVLRRIGEQGGRIFYEVF